MPLFVFPLFIETGRECVGVNRVQWWLHKPTSLLSGKILASGFDCSQQEGISPYVRRTIGQKIKAQTFCVACSEAQSWKVGMEQKDHKKAV